MSEESERPERTVEAVERMSANVKDYGTGLGKIPDIPNIPPPPKEQSRVTIPRGSKDQEIENLKRLLANISQRLDGLKQR